MGVPAGCVAHCPGCAHRDWTPERSLAQKREFLVATLPVDPPLVAETLGPAHELRWGYRAKTLLHCALIDGEWRFGLRKRKSGGRPGEFELVPIPECPAHEPRINRLLGSLALFLPLDDQAFPLSHVLISGPFTTLVLKMSRMPDLDWLNLMDWEAHRVEGVFLNLHPSAGRRVTTSKGWKKVWGVGRANFELLGSRIEFGPQSFLQQIPSLQEKALKAAESFLGPLEGDSVLDLCCGIGASMKLWSVRGARTIGVELGEESIRFARENTRDSIVPVELLQGRVSHRLPQLRTWSDSGKNRLLAFVNPPRLGLEAEVCDWLARETRLERIAYLSCSPGTLARDLRHFQAHGFEVKGVQPFDFFPQTLHVETLALLERRR